MFDESREITLSQAGKELADQPIVKNLLNAIEEADEYYPWVETPSKHGSFDVSNSVRRDVDDFTNSDIFKLFTDSEQDEAISISRSVIDKPGDLFWTIESTDSEECLEEIPRIHKVILTMAADALLLCGITIDDIYRVSPKSLNSHEDLGFKRRLDMANYIGACILSKPSRIFDTYVDFELGHKDGVSQVIGVGGSIHGDFRIRRSEHYIHGSIDPIGHRVMYAPKGPEKYLGAYHSTEPLILVALLKHIDKIGWSEEVQKQFIDKTLDIYKQQDNGHRGGELFADYGMSDAGFQIYDIEHYCDGELGRFEKEKAVWAILPLDPSINTSLIVKTEGEDFVIQNGDTPNGCSSFVPNENAKITIPPRYTGDFLLALLHQSRLGFGRTSNNNLLGILDARLKTDWHAT